MFEPFNESIHICQGVVNVKTSSYTSFELQQTVATMRTVMSGPYCNVQLIQSERYIVRVDFVEIETDQTVFTRAAKRNHANVNQLLVAIPTYLAEVIGHPIHTESIKIVDGGSK